MPTNSKGRMLLNEKKIYEKFYDKTIATDMSTTVSDPEIKNAVRIARI